MQLHQDKQIKYKDNEVYYVALTDNVTKKFESGIIKEIIKDPKFEEWTILDGAAINEFKSIYEDWNPVDLIEMDSYLMLHFSPVTRLSILSIFLNRELNEYTSSTCPQFELKILNHKIIEMSSAFLSFVNYERQLLESKIAQIMTGSKNNHNSSDSETVFYPVSYNEARIRSAVFFNKFSSYFENKLLHYIHKLYQYFDNESNGNDFYNNFCKKILNLSNEFDISKRNRFLNSFYKFDFTYYLQKKLNKDILLSDKSHYQPISNISPIEPDFFKLVRFNNFVSFLHNLKDHYGYYVKKNDDNSFTVGFDDVILNKADSFINDIDCFCDEIKKYFDELLEIVSSYPNLVCIDLMNFIYQLLESLLKALDQQLSGPNFKNSFFIYFFVLNKLFGFKSDLLNIIFKFSADFLSNPLYTYYDFYKTVVEKLPFEFHSFRYLIIYSNSDWLLNLLVPDNIFHSSKGLELKSYSLIYDDDNITVYIKCNLPFIKFVCLSKKFKSKYISIYSDEKYITLKRNFVSDIRIPYIITGLSPKCLSLMIFKYLDSKFNEKI